MNPVPAYPTYRHTRFHIIYCKAQNRHWKVRGYIEKVHLYVSQSIDHIIVANTFAGMYTSTLRTKNKPIFISTQKY